jgi:anti-anti-sigma regulatory factor
MFRISIVDTVSQRKLVVEGKLREPWLEELRTTWKNASRDLGGRKLIIDVSNLTVISRAGEDAIFDLMKQGAKFSCAGVCTRYVMKRLARACRGQARTDLEASETLKT